MNSTLTSVSGRFAEPSRPSGAALVVHTVQTAPERTRFEQLLEEKHYLGAAPPVGDFLRQVVVRDGQWVGLLVWGPAAYRLKDRERWIGWNDALRGERLKLVVQNRRFLLLHEKGTEPNLASQALAAASRALPAQWQAAFGYAPLVAESFTDPEQQAGTCYKASNWEPVGFSEGNSRHRADFYVPNERPKRLWLIELAPKARAQLCAPTLPAAQAAGWVAAPTGVLPLSQPQRRSLAETFRHAPDPRAKNTHYRIGPVLTLIAMALMAGARDVSEIARFATRLRHPQRRELTLPRRKDTRACYEVPGYSVFYQVLRHLDAEAFAALLSAWCQAQAGTLPGGLALDGKMIRTAIGMVTLAEHDDGSPRAMAIMDQKENTPRCEQTAALGLLEKLPPLDGCTVTADPLHCQKKVARTIGEKGGEYLLQIKGNQPTLHAYAARVSAAQSTPFLPRPNSATAATKSGA
jgi:hypothetical protein